ncbi:unnamed protein product [Effrenium voratum]|nr:unnamed protein product [Effrenium voratum]
MRAQGVDPWIEIDGGASGANAKDQPIQDIKEAGCNAIVAGSAVFNAPDYAEAVKAIKEALRALTFGPALERARFGALVLRFLGKYVGVGQHDTTRIWTTVFFFSVFFLLLFFSSVFPLTRLPFWESYFDPQARSLFSGCHERNKMPSKKDTRPSHVSHAAVSFSLGNVEPLNSPGMRS